MLLKPTLSRAPEPEIALDQARLYAKGLDQVRSLSRATWTDHNPHDPGITTLELLCYAMTELAYRAGFPIEDLLAADTPQGTADVMKQQFYRAREILPNAPLTINDYRKLVIDVVGIKNAWVQPVAARCWADTVEGVLLHADSGLPGVRPVDVQGRYNVLLEFDDDVANPVKAAGTAMALLQANRNLCEDFVNIDVVHPQFFALCAELELDPAADAVQVAARIRFEVENSLAPPVFPHTLAQMLARTHDDGSAYTAAEIFEGPALQHGFIADADLDAADLRTEIRLSDVIAVIMDIAGVRAVRDIVINVLSDPDPVTGKVTSGVPLDKWRIPVLPGRQPRLDKALWRFVFYKRDVPVCADPALVDAALQALEAAQQAGIDQLGIEDLPIPSGRFRALADYQSFQQHFPELYGLSDRGLPAHVGDQRQADVLQLKGYLLFFDQAMANYFAQLEGLGGLLSREAVDGAPTYRAQVVQSFVDWDRVYPAAIDNDKLTALFETPEAAVARRNRFLDHLLSRVAEDFHDYLNVMGTAFGADPASAIKTKCAFLQDYPALGAERAMAYDHTLARPHDLWNSANVSGLERRIARLLGIQDFSRRNLSALPNDIYPEIDATPDDEFRFRVEDPVTRKILLSSSRHYVTRDDARAEMVQAIARAQLPEGYQRKVADDGRHYFNIVDAANEVIARRIEYFVDPAVMEADIASMTAQLAVRYGGEGLYLVENLLLFPDDPHDPFMPICVDTNCGDCADLDPYSWRLQFVLPAYAGRFKDMAFRRFVEDTIRLETPAHLCPKVCWVDEQDMGLFEDALRDWIALRAGELHADRPARIQALVDAMFGVKNVYPPGVLHDCDSPLDEPPFILGRTALGSEKPAPAQDLQAPGE